MLIDLNSCNGNREEQSIFIIPCVSSEVRSVVDLFLGVNIWDWSFGTKNALWIVRYTANQNTVHLSAFEWDYILIH